MLAQKAEVAGLRDGVAGKVDNLSWLDLAEGINKFVVAAGAGWIKNDAMVGRDVCGDVFGFGENALGLAAGGIGLHFGEGGGVYFDHSQAFVASDGQADAADAGIKVDDGLSGESLGDGLERQFVGRQVDLEKAVG